MGESTRERIIAEALRLFGAHTSHFWTTQFHFPAAATRPNPPVTRRIPDRCRRRATKWTFQLPSGKCMCSDGSRPVIRIPRPGPQRPGAGRRPASPGQVVRTGFPRADKSGAPEPLRRDLG
jgi:hypothetical protein